MSEDRETFQYEYRRTQSTRGAEANRAPHRRHEAYRNALDYPEPQVYLDDETDEEYILRNVPGSGGNRNYNYRRSDVHYKKQNNNIGKQVIQGVETVVLTTAVTTGAVVGGVLGVAAGSVAAVADGAFTTLQSVGAFGLSALAKTGIVASGAAVTGATSTFRTIKDTFKMK